MTIDRDFSGGNIRVLDIQGNTVFLENELRDTQGDWFYWAFRVRGAEGSTLAFDFGDKPWIGPFGAAVSRDALDWTWTNTMLDGGKRFTYTFGPDEDCVYFCHDLHYSPERFERFVREMNWAMEPFAQSPRARQIPYLRVGEGSASVLLTARHHACESTGTFVMEGMLREYDSEPIPGLNVIAVPFVDCDGVLDGDQGKNRAPHDHNRDYIDEPIYDAVRRIKALAGEENIRYAFDLHSPYHTGGGNDHVFIVRKNPDKQHLQDEFSLMLEDVVAHSPGAMRYHHLLDMPVNTGWNQAEGMRATCGAYYAYSPNTFMGTTLETAYFGLEHNVATQESLIELGRCVMRALRAFQAAHKLD